MVDFLQNIGLLASHKLLTSNTSVVVTSAGANTGAGLWRVRYQAVYFSKLNIFLTVFVTLKAIALAHFMQNDLIT